MLVDGTWQTDWHPVQAKDKDGRFLRQTSEYRDWITPDGQPGPQGQRAFKAETGRYHLYVAYICPWASRVLMARSLKGLQKVITVTVVDPRLSEQGWRFGDFPGATGLDPEFGAQYLHEVYSHSDPDASGRATVPVLWDRVRKRIVNNESADILRILDSGFDAFGRADVSLRPAPLLDEIEALNTALYEPFNNGVYKAGFASSQRAYEEAVAEVFATLTMLEDRLSDGRAFLLGETLCESDLRAFVTLIRFDAAYVGLFKCNLSRVADHPALMGYMKRILALPGLRETVNIAHIKAGYYSIKALNPNGIIPAGPDMIGLAAGV